MQIKVNFLGFFRDRIGREPLYLELPENATYRDLLDALAPRVGDKLPDWAWDAEKRCFTRRLLVTRNLSGDLREEETVLADGDEVFVVPPIAGG